MKLLYQTHSPFARKALVFAHEVGLAGDLEVVHQETSPTLRNDVVFAENPLGKVPVLLRSDGPPIFDSDVICAYLDTMHRGRRLIPEAGELRWDALRIQAVAQGMCEAGIQVRWETVRRPERLRFPSLRDGYNEKLTASCDWLEANLHGVSAMHVGHIAVATALGWLEFRALCDFRAGRPRLAEWFDRFQERASMRATSMSGDTVDAIDLRTESAAQQWPR